MSETTDQTLSSVSEENLCKRNLISFFLSRMYLLNYRWWEAKVPR